MSCPNCDRIISDIAGSGYGGDCFGCDFSCDDCKRERWRVEKRKEIESRIEQLREELERL